MDGKPTFFSIAASSILLLLLQEQPVHASPIFAGSVCTWRHDGATIASSRLAMADTSINSIKVNPLRGSKLGCTYHVAHLNC